MAKEKLSTADKIKYVQDTLYVINGKWKLLILMAMHDGVNRFRDLQRSVPNITTRVLSKELKELEANQLITRTIQDTYPAAITYALTTYSYSLTSLVDEMILWGKQHRKKVTGKK